MRTHWKKNWSHEPCAHSARDPLFFFFLFIFYRRATPKMPPRLVININIHSRRIKKKLNYRRGCSVDGDVRWLGVAYKSQKTYMCYVRAFNRSLCFKYFIGSYNKITGKLSTLQKYILFNWYYKLTEKKHCTTFAQNYVYFLVSAHAPYILRYDDRAPLSVVYIQVYIRHKCAHIFLYNRLPNQPI